MPDGRTRRATLSQKHVDPPLYQQVADEVMTLWRQKMLLLQDIADKLKIDRNTVTAAVRWWHKVRELPVPDGRTRRKELDHKTSLKSPPSEDESPAEVLENQSEADPNMGEADR